MDIDNGKGSDRDNSDKSKYSIVDFVSMDGVENRSVESDNRGKWWWLNNITMVPVISLYWAV